MKYFFDEKSKKDFFNLEALFFIKDKKQHSLFDNLLDLEDVKKNITLVKERVIRINPNELLKEDFLFFLKDLFHLTTLLIDHFNITKNTSFLYEALEISKKSNYYFFTGINYYKQYEIYFLLYKTNLKEKDLKDAIYSLETAFCTEESFSNLDIKFKVDLSILYLELSYIEEKSKNIEKSINILESIDLNNQDYFEKFNIIENLLKSYLLLEVNEINLLKYIKFLENNLITFTNGDINSMRYHINLAISYFDLFKITQNIDYFTKSYKNSSFLLENFCSDDVKVATYNLLGDLYFYLSNLLDSNKISKMKSIFMSYSNFVKGFDFCEEKSDNYNLGLFSTRIADCCSTMLIEKEKKKFSDNEIKDLKLNFNIIYEDFIYYYCKSIDTLSYHFKYTYNSILAFDKAIYSFYSFMPEFCYDKSVLYINQLENRRYNLAIREKKEDLSEVILNIYLNMIKICLFLMKKNINDVEKLTYYKAELFKYIEMSKTRTLIDVINSKENGRIIFDESLAENDPELVKKIKSLNEFEDSIANIEKLEDILSEESSNLRGFISESKLKINSEKLKKNKKKKKELERKKKDLLDELYKYPHIKARLSQINGKIIPLNELISMIGNQISSNTSILQYYISEEFYVINVINENKNKNENITTFFQDDFEKVSKLNFWLELYSDCFDLFGLREEESYFKDKVERIKKKYINLDIKDLDDDKFKNYILSLLGKELYKYLIEPIEEFIQGKKRLMFISDSKLHNFSFNILQKDDKFLIDYLYLYKLPSASLWVSLKDKMNQDFKEINVFATSEYNKYTKLKKVSKEVNHIENTFKKDLNLYKDNDVKPLSIKEKIKESSILTLIGHGYYEDKDSGYIYIDGEEDLKLSISTIFSSFPSFDRNMLVILSICHGGKQLFSGQEIIGINSVFLMLGAGGIISNLIELSDEIAEKFSEIFYEKLSNRIIYKDGNEDKLDIFYQSIRELKDLSNKSKRVNKIADWAFLEFQGNPSF